eukprot:gene13688-17473_t
MRYDGPMRDNEDSEPVNLHWRRETATRAGLIVDASDYFEAGRKAMLKARRRIMLIGWDFDARIALEKSDPADDGPETVGDFIHWLVERNPGLE